MGNSITLVKLSKLINIFFSNITLSYTIGRVFIDKILRQKMLGSFCQLVKKLASNLSPTMIEAYWLLFYCWERLGKGLDF